MQCIYHPPSGMGLSHNPRGQEAWEFRAETEKDRTAMGYGREDTEPTRPQKHHLNKTRNAGGYPAYDGPDENGRRAVAELGKWAEENPPSDAEKSAFAQSEKSRWAVRCAHRFVRARRLAVGGYQHWGPANEPPHKQWQKFRAAWAAVADLPGWADAQLPVKLSEAIALDGDALTARVGAAHSALITSINR